MYSGGELMGTPLPFSFFLAGWHLEMYSVVERADGYCITIFIFFSGVARTNGWRPRHGGSRIGGAKVGAALR